MARLSIYITDELKARMDEVGDEVNWSEVARPAIQAAIASHEHRRSPSMTSAIERLRASKQEAMQEVAEKAERDGRKWAEECAKYKELLRISKIKDPTLTNLFQAAENLEVIQEEEEEADWEPSDEYAAGFIKGAQEFFEEIRHKL